MTRESRSFESPVGDALAGASSRAARLELIREHTRPFAPAPSLAAREDDASSLSNRLTAMGGLGGTATAVPVTHGECIIVVHDDIDHTSDCTLCGVEIGHSGKLCFKDNCSTNSHVQLRAEPDFWVSKGIYVRTGTSGASKNKVYKSVSDMKSKLESVKKLADKALTRSNSGGGSN